MSLVFITRTLASLALPLVLATSLAACSGLQRITASLPDASVMDALPVIKLGQAKPVQGDYIVYLPASEPVTATTKVQGTLFEKTDSKELQVKLKQDLYLYKYWVSFDKRQWVKDTDAVTGHIHVILPGYDHPQAGEVLIELNTKAAPGASRL
jgi:methionine-rich copper-binding protein CopC